LYDSQTGTTAWSGPSVVERAAHHQQADRAGYEQIPPLPPNLILARLALAVERVSCGATLGCLIAHVAHGLSHGGSGHDAGNGDHARGAQAEVDDRAHHLDYGRRAVPTLMLS
jgi:hypothetical protein